VAGAAAVIAWERPLLLIAAVLIAALGAGAALLWQRRRGSRLAALGGDAAQRRLAPTAHSSAGLRRALRLGAASVLAAVALAGPRWGTAREVIRTNGGDVVLAMDASLSMLADDERPTRLERMKQEVRRFRAASPGDRIALIAFAGRAYVLSPLTSDDGALELFLDNLDPSIVGQPGTALAPAITGALDLLQAAQGGAGKAIVLLTDGEGFDDRAEAIKAAQRARQLDVRLIAVGFGTPGGTSIPLRTTNGVEAKRDENGDIVITRYEPETLAEVARVAEGEFIPAEVSNKGARIARALSTLEAKQRAAAAGLAMPARYQWLLGLAVLLLLFDAWWADGGRLSRRWLPRRWWRTAASIGVALTAAMAPASARGQTRADQGLREFKEGRVADAVRSYRTAVGRGDRSPRTLYNFGTVLLAADSLDAAIDALERAQFGATATLRDRALYNLGLAQLTRARRAVEGDERIQSARGALAAFRTLLLARPKDADARWNYELALRLRRTPPPQSGGGGSREDEQSTPQQPRDPSGMSQQQAAQLLDAAARDERDTQSRRRRVPQRDRPPGGKDW
jgi:Ca-activated chloride channel family protein